MCVCLMTHVHECLLPQILIFFWYFYDKNIHLTFICERLLVYVEDTEKGHAIHALQLFLWKNIHKLNCYTHVYLYYTYKKCLNLTKFYIQFTHMRYLHRRRHSRICITEMFTIYRSNICQRKLFIYISVYIRIWWW